MRRLRIPRTRTGHSVLMDLHVPSSALTLPGGSGGKESAHNVGDLGSIPGSGRSPGEGNGNPLQNSCLENSMNRETGQANLKKVRHTFSCPDFSFVLQFSISLSKWYFHINTFEVMGQHYFLISASSGNYTSFCCCCC